MPLRNVETSSTANVAPGAALQFTFGVDLDKAPDTLRTQDYFLDASRLAGIVDVSATNISLNGSYAWLDVVSSGGAGSSRLAVELRGLESRLHIDDPLPQTTFSVTGSADFQLHNFLPKDNAFEVHGDRITHFTWSNLGDLGTRALTVPSEFLCYQYLVYNDLVDTLRGEATSCRNWRAMPRSTPVFP